MWTFLKLAFRNLLRHKRRSVLTGMMIAVGALTMFLSFSFNHTVAEVMAAASTRAYAGNIQIHAATDEKIDLFFPAPDEVPMISHTERIMRRIRANPQVLAVAPRLRFGGLVSKGEDPASEAEITAIDPGQEPYVTPRLRVIRGTYLTRKDGILLGKSAAKKFNAKIGQELILVASNPDGHINGYPFIVQGIISHEGIGMFLDYMMYIDIATARKLLYLNNDQTYELAVALKDNANGYRAISEIRSDLAAGGFKLRVESWDKVMPIIAGIIKGIKVIPRFMLFILLMVIAMGIINTVTMSVLERAREIGTMAALGTRGKQVLGILVLEIGILSVISTGVGLVIGTGIVLWLGHTGIPITVEAMEFFTGGKRFYFIFNETGLLLSFSGIVLISILAAYFPARKATRLSPVEALRRD